MPTDSKEILEDVYEVEEIVDHYPKERQLKNKKMKLCSRSELKKTRDALYHRPLIYDRVILFG